MQKWFAKQQGSTKWRAMSMVATVAMLMYALMAQPMVALARPAQNNSVTITKEVVGRISTQVFDYQLRLFRRIPAIDITARVIWDDQHALAHRPVGEMLHISLYQGYLDPADPGFAAEAKTLVQTISIPVVEAPAAPTNSNDMQEETEKVMQSVVFQALPEHDVFDRPFVYTLGVGDINQYSYAITQDLFTVIYSFEHLTDVEYNILWNHGTNDPSALPSGIVDVKLYGQDGHGQNSVLLKTEQVEINGLDQHRVAHDVLKYRFDSSIGGLSTEEYSYRIEIELNEIALIQILQSGYIMSLAGTNIEFCYDGTPPPPRSAVLEPEVQAAINSGKMASPLMAKLPMIGRAAPNPAPAALPVELPIDINDYAHNGAAFGIAGDAEDGYTFRLRAGESLSISGLPNDVFAEVTELTQDGKAENVLLVNDVTVPTNRPYIILKTDNGPVIKFRSTGYCVEASAGFGGTISPSGTVYCAPGEAPQFQIVPAAGYVIDQVYVDGAPQGAISQYTFPGLTGSHTINATFSSIYVPIWPPVPVPVTPAPPTATPEVTPSPTPTSRPTVTPTAPDLVSPTPAPVVTPEPESVVTPEPPATPAPESATPAPETTKKPVIPATGQAGTQVLYGLASAGALGAAVLFGQLRRKMRNNHKR